MGRNGKKSSKFSKSWDVTEFFLHVDFFLLLSQVSAELQCMRLKLKEPWINIVINIFRRRNSGAVIAWLREKELQDWRNDNQVWQNEPFNSIANVNVRMPLKEQNSVQDKKRIHQSSRSSENALLLDRQFSNDETVVKSWIRTY